MDVLNLNEKSLRLRLLIQLVCQQGLTTNQQPSSMGTQPPLQYGYTVLDHFLAQLIYQHVHY